MGGDGWQGLRWCSMDSEEVESELLSIGRAAKRLTMPRCSRMAAEPGA